MKNCKKLGIATSVIIIAIVSVLGFQNYQKFTQDRHFKQIITDLNNLEINNEQVRKSFGSVASITDV